MPSRSPSPIPEILPIIITLEGSSGALLAFSSKGKQLNKLKLTLIQVL
jgi:hypothetical protein